MLFEKVKELGECKLLITEFIEYCSVSDFVSDEEQINNKFFFLDENNNVIIRKGIEVKGRIASNSGLKLYFEDGSYIDIAFNENEDYDKYFKII